MDVAREIKNIVSVLAHTNPVIFSTIAPFDIIVTPDKSVPTAATDGYTIVVNEEFVKKLFSEPEGAKKVAALLAHEALHNILGHPLRARLAIEAEAATTGLPAPLLANAANIITDAIIDRYLRDLLGVSNKYISEKAVDIETASRLLRLSRELLEHGSFERIFAEFIEQNKDMFRDAANKAADALSDRVMDDASGTKSDAIKKAKMRGKTAWKGKKDVREAVENARKAVEKAIKKMRKAAMKTSGEAAEEEEEEEGIEGKTGRRHGEEKEGHGGGQGQQEETGEVKGGHGSDITGALEEVEKALNEAMDAIAEAVREAAITAKAVMETTRSVTSAKPAGVGKGGLERVLDELARGRIDWKKIVTKTLDAITPAYVKRTWSRLNKKQPGWRPGVTMVGGIEEVIAAIDTSGSMTDEELKRIAEVLVDAAARLKPKKMTIVAWDYGINRVTRITGTPYKVKEILRKGALAGGGGTSIREALEYAIKQAKKRPGRVVAIFASDWYVEEDPNIVKKLIEQLRRHKAKVVVLATPDHDKEVFRAAAEAADLARILPPENPFERAEATPIPA